MAIAHSIREHMRNSSWIRRMFEAGVAMKEERGEANVFDLSLGNPDMDPPPEFYRELRRIANNPKQGMHRYMPNAGYSDTRSAIAAQLSKETGLLYRSEHIMMCVGAGGGINVTLRAILNPGDEVVIFAPFFAEYLFYVTNHQGVPVVVDCDPQFVPDLSELEAKLTPRTKAVILNSPNNPSGVVYDADTIDRITSVLERTSREANQEIYLISDEPYRRLLFDGLQYPFPQHAYQQTITITSHSKDLALPGERIGYVAIHPSYPEQEELMDALVFCNRVLGFVNAPALMQHIVKALQNVTVDVNRYQQKRDYIYESLTTLGYRAVRPQGAFYMFPESPMKDELVIVEALRRHGVLVVPGRGFGISQHFRISFCVPDAVLEGAVKGFGAVANELGLT